MDVSVFELLPNGASCFTWASRLQSDDFNELGDTTEILLFVCLRGEILDCDSDSREWFLL
jgi:hypothetical protein